MCWHENGFRLIWGFRSEKKHLANVGPHSAGPVCIAHPIATPLPDWEGTPLSTFHPLRRSYHHYRLQCLHWLFFSLIRALVVSGLVECCTRRYTSCTACQRRPASEPRPTALWRCSTELISERLSIAILTASYMPLYASYMPKHNQFFNYNWLCFDEF